MSNGCVKITRFGTSMRCDTQVRSSHCRSGKSHFSGSCYQKENMKSFFNIYVIQYFRMLFTHFFLDFQLQQLSADLEKHGKEKREITDKLDASRRQSDQLETQLEHVKQDHEKLKEINVQLVEQIENMKGEHVHVFSSRNSRCLSPSH